MAWSSASSSRGRTLASSQASSSSAAERDEVAPLVAQAEHVGEQRLAVGEVAVAMQQEIAEGGVEARSSPPSCSRVRRAASRWSGSASVGGGQAAAAAGEDREGAGDLGADASRWCGC